MTKKPKILEWTITSEHIYNTDVVKCPVWAKSFPRGTVYIMEEDHFMFTASFGANSDYSYTGCFFECDKVKNIHDAMKVLDVWIPIHLSNNRKEKFQDVINRVMG